MDRPGIQLEVPRDTEHAYMTSPGSRAEAGLDPRILVLALMFLPGVCSVFSEEPVR